MPGIIVGVDGSDESGQALGWAMGEAALRHVPLTVLTVREPRLARPPKFTGVCAPFRTAASAMSR